MIEWKMTLTVKKRVGYNREVVETDWADLLVNDYTRLADFVRFEEEAKEIWKKTMKMIRAEQEFELELVGSSVDKFDRWVSVPVTEQDCEGIYLKADTRYTDECRDLYLTKEVMEDLGNQL